MADMSYNVYVCYGHSHTLIYYISMCVYVCVTDSRQLAEHSDAHLERQNDELVDTLAQQVSTLKSVRPSPM